MAVYALRRFLKGYFVMKPSIIYILGSGHSGSTILQYLLASRPNVIGLGEVRQMADRLGREKGDSECSCGRPVKNCPLWKDFHTENKETTFDWYKRLVYRTMELYPHGSLMVDTSKSIHTIAPWITLASEGVISEVIIIYLVRDVRGWAVSDENTRKRKQRRSRLIFMSILSWWKDQLLITRFINNKLKKFNTLSVSYESLIFQTESQLSRIDKFCNLNNGNRNWEDALQTSIVHDVFGNRMKNEPSKRTKLIYDDRWQYRFSVNLMLLILYPVWKLNSKIRKQGGI